MKHTNMKTVMQESIEVLLSRSIFNLCKNRLDYTNTFTVKGVLEISTDNSRAFFVDIQEEFDGCKHKQDESSECMVKLEDGSLPESNTQRKRPTVLPVRGMDSSKNIVDIPCPDNTVCEETSSCTFGSLGCISAFQPEDRESHNDTEQSEIGEVRVKIEPQDLDRDEDIEYNNRKTEHFNISAQPGCPSWVNHYGDEGLQEDTTEDIKPDLPKEVERHGEEGIIHANNVKRTASSGQEILGVWNSQKESEDATLMLFLTPASAAGKNSTEERHQYPRHDPDGPDSEACSNSTQPCEQQSLTHEADNAKLDSCKKNGENKKTSGPQHSGKLHYCDVCNKEFDRPSALKKHRRVHTGERPYICKICDRAFSQNGTLKRHYNTHTRETSYKCKTCDKSFAHLASLTRHYLSHTGEKPYICEICGKRFSRKCLLQEHSRTHTGEKPYVCKICGKGFAHVYNLTVHRRIHLAEKVFTCGVCGKGFNHQCGLKRHLWKHSGEEPFVCKTCGKGFYQSSCLKRHLSIHTGVKLFVCKLCGKGFNQGSQLREHNLKHTDPTPYACNVCGEKFPSQKRLKKHQVKNLHS